MIQTVLASKETTHFDVQKRSYAFKTALEHFSHLKLNEEVRSITPGVSKHPLTVHKVTVTWFESCNDKVLLQSTDKPGSAAESSPEEDSSKTPTDPGAGTQNKEEVTVESLPTTSGEPPKLLSQKRPTTTHNNQQSDTTDNRATKAANNTQLKRKWVITYW